MATDYLIRYGAESLNEKERQEVIAATIPPYNPDCEAAILGAMMIQNKVIEIVRDRLTGDEFHEPLHKEMFETICSLVDRGIAANPVTLKPYFKDRNIHSTTKSDADWVDDDETKSKTVTQYFMEITQTVLPLLGIREFCEQLIELSTWRKMHTLFWDEIKAISSLDGDKRPDDVMGSLDEKFSEMQGAGIVLTGESFADAWDASVDRFERIGEGEIEAGIEISLYSDWNDVAGPMVRGEHTLIGARPSMGKTGLGLVVAQGAAAAGYATEFVSLEMGVNAITNRSIANIMYTPGYTSKFTPISKGVMTADDREYLSKAREAVAGWPLHMTAPDTMAIEDLLPFLRRRQRAWKELGKELSVVVVDYLGLFTTRKSFFNRSAEVGYISNMLKHIAKVLDIALVTLAQLSRQLEQREDKRPIMSDLRDSGELEQDADTIVFMYRDAYYLKAREPADKTSKKYQEWELEMRAVEDRVEIYSAKRRNGAPTKRTGFYLLDFQAFRPSDWYDHSKEGFKF